MKGITEYAKRRRQEIERFEREIDVHALPEIFHYWSNRYLRPMCESLGFAYPEDFFAREIERIGCLSSRDVRVVSIGAGNCDSELRIAELLLERGLSAFRIECLDVNPVMLARGLEMASRSCACSHLSFSCGDFNDWRPRGRYDVVIANQSLHHVVELECLFDRIFEALVDDGAFVASDMIGRNGHQRWPEALSILQAFWSELPKERRWNVQLKRYEPEFMNWDCSVEGFEGIRSQDILPELMKRFGFTSFLAYGNIIDPFIDRSFGHHFDANDEHDRTFIDRVHARDEAEILAGNIKPTHMIASMCKDRSVQPRTWRHLTPSFCVRPVVREGSCKHESGYVLPG